jgi:hypothetical protein
MADELRVYELGEVGDAYLVEGTDDVAVAKGRLRTYLEEYLEPEDVDASFAQFEATPGQDWWWEEDEEREESVLRRHTAEEPAPDDAILTTAVRFS